MTLSACSSSLSANSEAAVGTACWRRSSSVSLHANGSRARDTSVSSGSGDLKSGEITHRVSIVASSSVSVRSMTSALAEAAAEE